MKLITWMVALYNRKWQRKLDTMTTQANEEDVSGKLTTKYEPMVETPTKEEIMEAIESQPTHLSGKYWARPIRKYKKKEVNKYGNTSD